MHHFFVETDLSEGMVSITGADYNHLKNVLRIREGEEILVSTPEGDVVCETEEILENEVRCRVVRKEEDRELCARVTLFQGLPKADKMELIIQKAVELGAHRVIPVAMKNSVVKLDAKKAKSKTQRWQEIAKAAAKQAKRSVIPEVLEPVSFSEAISMSQNAKLRLLLYEHADNIGKTMEAISNLNAGDEIMIFIGPEGGFDQSEIDLALQNGIEPMTLGRRILRTETAAITALSLVMIMLEKEGAEK